MEKLEWFTDEFRASVPKAWIHKRDRREVEEVIEVREQKKDVVVKGEEKQGVRRKSIIDTLRNRNIKIAPAGVKKEQCIEVQEFKREMERRGSIMG